MLDPISIYIHWPFCVSKCPYCDFNSHVREKIDQATWQQALLKEIKLWKGKVGDKRIKSIFFGGGTPSLMAPQTVEALIESINHHFTCDNNMEITLEANPSTVEYNRFKDFRKAGINRVSIGVQSFDEDELKFLGRKHSADEAKKAIHSAQDIFDRYSFDLIYALPNQTLESWEKALREAIPYTNNHISLYQLTIEKETAFYNAHARGDFILPSEELSAQMYELTDKIMEEHDMPAYEVSNYGKDFSEHNMVYWRYQDYLGIGPGAHGRITLDNNRYATYNYKLPETWLSEVMNNNNGTQTTDLIDPHAAFYEFMLMNLRITEGVSIERIAEYKNIKYENNLNVLISIFPRIGHILEQEFLVIQDGYLKPTLKGRQRLNAILNYILHE